MRYDAEHKAKTRDLVLKEAARAIRRDGPHKVGVAAVMAKAGLTHGGFYAHFASKDDFVAQAVGRMFEEGRRQFSRVTEGKSGEEGVVAYIDFYLSEAHRDTRTHGCPLPFLAADAPRLGEASRARYAAGVSYLTEGLATILTSLGHDEAQAEAASALSEMVGALSLSRAEPDPERSSLILAHSRAALKRRLGLELTA
jgi:TetR/AcrR family transcriptional repressor of nem operon